MLTGRAACSVSSPLPIRTLTVVLSLPLFVTAASGLVSRLKSAIASVRGADPTEYVTGDWNVPLPFPNITDTLSVEALAAEFLSNVGDGEGQAAIDCQFGV